MTKTHGVAATIAAGWTFIFLGAWAPGPEAGVTFMVTGALIIGAALLFRRAAG